MSIMIKNCSTIFFTNNRMETLNYYRKLGFHVDDDFGFVEREGLAVIFHEASRNEILRNYPYHGEHALDIYCMVSDAEELYNEFVSSGAIIHKALIITGFNLKEFSIMDPSGFTIGFGQSLID